MRFELAQHSAQFQGFILAAFDVQVRYCDALTAVGTTLAELYEN
jgi:hypothetical protein